MSDIYSHALVGAMGRDLSVADLIRAADTLKKSGQSSSAETLYATWIEHNREHPLLSAVLFNHSVLLSDAGKLEAARACLERSIELAPDFMPAYINLGRVFERQGHPNLAILQWSAALSRMAAVNGPSVTYKTTALNQSARALEAAGQDAAAESMLRQSLEIDPHQREAVQHLVALRQRQCEWPVIAPSDRVDARTLVHGMSPLSAAAFTDDPLLQLALAAHYNEAEVSTPEKAMDAWPRATAPSPRLRIGYLSSDLREHAVGYLMTDVLGLHDRSAFEIFAYDCGPASAPANDPLREHFQKTSDRWTPISNLDDATAARRIAEDGVQILVDLNGYTREARLKVVGLRPAPVIVNWLGFPGTMASPYHHYLVADEWIVPKSHERYYSERVLRLDCYQPNATTRSVAPAPARKDLGLPADGTVFCCFNGTHKLNRFTFDRWLLVLRGVEGSVLWLLASDEASHERLRAYARERGIAPERLVFAPKVHNPLHLARYAAADIFLDTAPYGAHTTASDALYMGVPVVTLSGRSFASRVCGSLVRAAGTPELVCTSAEAFVEVAVELGRDRAARERVREALRSARSGSTLFDMPKLVRRLEELYRQMWSEFSSGRLPCPDVTNLGPYLEVGARHPHEEIELLTIPDYQGLWVEKLAERHRVRPIAMDDRLGGLVHAKR